MIEAWRGEGRLIIDNADFETQSRVEGLAYGMW